MSRWRGWPLYTTLWVAMMLLRQDSWQWTDARLVGGVLPVGLAWQAGYSLVAAGLMWALVRWHWPAELERLEGPHD